MILFLFLHFLIFLLSFLLHLFLLLLSDTSASAMFHLAQQRQHVYCVKMLAQTDEMSLVNSVLFKFYTQNVHNNIVHFPVGTFVNNSMKYVTLGLRNSNRFPIHCLLGMLIYVYKVWKGLVQSGNHSSSWVPSCITKDSRFKHNTGLQKYTLSPCHLRWTEKNTLRGSQGQQLLTCWVIHNFASCIWWSAWSYISVYISLILIIRKKKKKNQSCVMLPPYFTQLK